MTKREWALALLLAAAGACVVRGVAVLSVSGAWVVAGVLLAALAWLTLSGADEADE